MLELNVCPYTLIYIILTTVLRGSLLLFSHSAVYDSLQPHGLQQARLSCPSLTLGVCSNSSLLSQWCLPTISSSVFPFSSCPQSFPASGSFPVSWLFTSGDQSIGALASVSVLSMNIQVWFPLGWTGLISLQVSKVLSRVFSSTSIQKHQFSDVGVHMCVCAVAQSCLTLCDPINYSPPDSSVCGILQVRTMEWVVISFSRGSSQPRDWTQVSCIAGRFFTIWATREAPVADVDVGNVY